MMTVAHIVAISVFVYLLFGFLTSYSIKRALSRHPCDCKKKAIEWKVPFDPNWIFTFSSEINLTYSGKCRICGNHHQAKIESKQTTFSTSKGGQQHERRK